MVIRRDEELRGLSEEPSSSRTQRRMLVEPSSALDISVVEQPEVNDATQPTLARPRIIVMEERPIGLSDALEQMGFMVRSARTGVEAISMCSDAMPLAVVVGPGDAERRRILTGALSVRFPELPVVHVRADADANRSLSDGVRVLSWPLPSLSEVMAVIPHRAEAVVANAPLPSITRVVPPTAAIRPRSASDVPELSADQSETGSVPRERLHFTPATTSPPPEATLTAARPVSMPLPPMELPFLDDDTLQVAKVAMPMTSMSDERSTSPGMKPAADVQDALAPRGDIADVLRAVAPFLWGLDDCSRFLDDLVQHHVPGADVHARTIRLVSRLLAQLNARIDELEGR